jgi:hypothetical protein
VVTESWLKKQYEAATAGTIAACLFNIWAYHGEHGAKHFLTGALGRRLAIELGRLRQIRGLELAGAISLFGCCSLLASTERVSPRWPTLGQTNEMLTVAAPKQNLTQIGHVQVQIWLGLREIIRRMPEEVQIPSELGEPVLLLWRKAEPTTTRHTLLNSIMIQWLEGCSRSGWLLTREPRSLFEELGDNAASLPPDAIAD